MPYHVLAYVQGAGSLPTYADRSFALDENNAEGFNIGFGFDVDIDGQYSVVSAPFEASLGNQQGAVFVYDNSNGNLLHKLAHPRDNSPAGDFSDMFGHAVGISGDYIVATSPREDSPFIGNSDANPGYAFIFDRVTGNVLHEIANPNTGVERLGDLFGTSVAIDGNLIAIGAPFYNNDQGQNGGAVFVYNTSGTLLHTLINPRTGTVNDAQFGASVDLDGNTLVVGASRVDVPVYSNGSATPEVYVYDLTNPSSPTHTIPFPEAGSNGNFGQAVGVSGNFFVTGAHTVSTDGFTAGRAYVFDVSTGNLLHTLLNPTPSSADWFGYDVAIDGTRILISALYAEVGGTDEAGEVYQFDASTGNLVATISNPNPVQSGSGPDMYGYDMAISGKYALIGSYRADEQIFLENPSVIDNGAVYGHNLT